MSAAIFTIGTQQLGISVVMAHHVRGATHRLQHGRTAGTHEADEQHSPAGTSRRQRRTRPATLLERLGLAGRLYYHPEALSGGEMQCVAMARALIADPPLLLADEPTANLDSASGHQVLHLCKTSPPRPTRPSSWSATTTVSPMSPTGSCGSQTANSAAAKLTTQPPPARLGNGDPHRACRRPPSPRVPDRSLLVQVCLDKFNADPDRYTSDPTRNRA
jgi:hypothetical protein